MDTGSDPRFEEIMLSRADPEGFYGLLGMRLEELAEGASRFVMSTASRLFNAGGVVHGGALASIADASIAAALATLIDPDREAIATIEIKINYIAPVREGEVTAEGRIIQRGKSVAVGESSVYDAEGRLLARAMATYAIKVRP
jgi:uncharacterized protein (TIGR00369 family)